MQNLHNEDFEVTRQDKTKKYKDLNMDQKQELRHKILENINNLESKLQDISYLKPTIIAGTRTAIETIIGYTAGRIIARLTDNNSI